MSNEVSLVGSKDVAARLVSLPDKIRTTIEKEAVAEANKLLVGRIRGEIRSVDSGMLRKSVGAVVRQYQGGRIVIGIIGPRSDFAGYVAINKKTKQKSFKRYHRISFRQSERDEANKWKVSGKYQVGAFRRPAKYAHLVEGGTAVRQTQDNKNRGSAPADDFMQRGIDGCRNEIIGIFEKAVNDAVNS